MLRSAANQQRWKNHVAAAPPILGGSAHVGRQRPPSVYGKGRSVIKPWGFLRTLVIQRMPIFGTFGSGRDISPGEDAVTPSSTTVPALTAASGRVVDLTTDDSSMGVPIEGSSPLDPLSPLQEPLVLTSVERLPHITESPLHFPPSPSLPGDSWQTQSSPSLANSPWQVLPSQPSTNWTDSSNSRASPPSPNAPLGNSPAVAPSEPPSPPATATRASYSDYYRTQHNSSASESEDVPTSFQPLQPTPPQPLYPVGSNEERGRAPQDPWSVPASAVIPEGGDASNAAASGKGSPATPDTEVASAMARAHAALAKAESSLDSIENLQSASPPSPFEESINRVRAVVIAVAVAIALLACHAFGLGWQWLGACAGGAGVALWGYSRGALSKSGAIAAVIVGAGTFGCSLRFAATLLAFFFSSSKLTKYKEEMKEALDDSSKKGGQRDWVQVMCNGLVPTLLAVSYGVLAGCADVPLGLNLSVEVWRAQGVTALMGGFLGYYSCCCGDTWASELGPLSTDTPRLITTGRPVRKGTNGGVTLLGTSASIFGGMAMGLVFYLAGLVSPTIWVVEAHREVALTQWRLIPLGLMAGLFGSLLDSLLGATLQYSGYNRITQRVTGTAGPDVTHISGMAVLDNNAVNLSSASITAALTAAVALKMFGC